MTHAITINVSDALYRQLHQAASLFHQPTEAIILDSLRHTLPSIFEDIPAGYQDEVFPLLAMNDQDLLQESRRTFPPDRWQHYESLLEQKKEGQLPPDDEQALQALRREADVLTFRRSYAAVLLKRRGYQLTPPRGELQSA
jgi:hypothetical protein